MVSCSDFTLKYVIDEKYLEKSCHEIVGEDSMYDFLHQIHGIRMILGQEYIFYITTFFKHLKIEILPPHFKPNTSSKIC